MKKIILIIVLVLFPIVSIGQNNSLNFDGTDDHVDLGSSFGFENSDVFTVEAWIKLSSVSGFEQIVSKLDNNFRGWGLQITSSGAVSGYLFSTFLSNQRYVEGITLVNDGQWHHVAMVYDAENIILYLDGNLEPVSSTDLGVLGSILNSSNTHIGNYHGDGNSGEYFNGNIDEVRLWDVAKSESEIASLYNTELSGTETNLIGYYKMDVTDSSCDVDDCNSNENHGDRNGTSGDNNLPQFDLETPTLTDVACGASTVCNLAVETFNEINIKLFPNPTSGEMTVIGNEINELTVEVRDILGKRINKMVVLNQKIDISNLPNGLYFVVLQANNASLVKKIIKK